MKRLLSTIVLLALVGCQQQGNLTWTPTATEWQAMTPGQRNAWYRLEMEADESARPTVYPNNNSTYWQERNARNQYLYGSGVIDLTRDPSPSVEESADRINKILHRWNWGPRR